MNGIKWKRVDHPLSLFKPNIMITENLVIENMQGDYLISQRNTDSLKPLVEFTELTDHRAESDWGQIRMLKSKMDGSIVLQLRGRTAIDSVGEKKNLVASTRLDLRDLRELCYIAEELSGEVKKPERDRLRVQVQEAEDEIARLRLQLKEAQDALCVLEG